MVHFNTLAANSSPASSARISIVDAKVDTQDYVQWLLSRGYEVEVVSDRLAALDAVQRYLPDLVLIDVMMLGLDSLELLRSLRNNPATQSIPLIVLSARTAEELQIEGLEAEADDYLLKPFSARELLARVRTNLELARLRRETVRYQEQLRVEAQAAQTQVSNILESITDAFVAFDREWRYTYVNEYATQLLRKKREQLLGKNVWTEVFPELVGTESYWEYHRAIAEQVPVVFEKFSQPIGRWIEVNAYPSPDGLAVYFRDITHRKQAEQALRESEERFRQLAENLDTVFFMSEDFSEASPGRIAYVSPAYERIWGRSCESLYQNTRSWFEAVHPDDRERVQQALPGMARAQFNLEFRIVRPDGEICWVRDRVFPIYNEQGEIYRTTGIVEDITKRKQIEAALQQREAELRLITDSVPVLISFVDTEQRYRFNNRTYETWFGHPASEVYGKHLRDVLGEAAYQVLLPYVEQVLAGQPVTFESEIPYKDGGIRYVSVTYVPQFDRQGNVEGFVALVSDISDRKQAELEIQKFVSLADNSSEFIGMCDMNFVPFYVNEAGRQMVGLDDTRQYSETPVREFFFPEDQDFIVNDFFPRVLREGRAEVEIRFRHFETGEALWMIYNVFYIRGENDQQIALASVSRNITDRKLAEVALRESEFRFRNIADHSPIMIWMSAPDGAGTWFNQQWCEFTGQTLEEALGSGWLAAVHPEDARSIETICLQAHQRHEPVRLEYRLRRQDGEYRWVFDCAIARFDDTGVYLGYIGSIIDITDRKLAEAELQRREQEFRAVVENTPDLIIRYDRSLRHLYVNPSLERALGIPAEQFIGRTAIEMGFTDATSLAWNAALQPVFVTAQDSTFEFELPNPEGERHSYQAYFVPELVQDGEVKTVLAVVRDVTKYKRTQEALRQSEERYRLALQAARMVTWAWDAKTDRIVRAQTACDVMGLPAEALQGTGSQGWLFVYPDDLAQHQANVQAAIDSKGNYISEFRMIRPDNGEVIWLEDRGQVNIDATGHLISVEGTLFDISDRKQAQQELQQTLQTLSTLIKASPLPIIVIEPNMTVKLWNPAAEQLFGWSEAEVLGQPLPIVPQEKRDECRQVREAVAKGEVFAGVETYRCKRDGATVMVSISAAALHNEQGSLNAILLIFQDITERQQAEQALRQSEERYRYLAESIPQLVWTANAKGVLLDVNQRWLDYTGLTLEQAQIEGWQAIVHPDDLPMLSQHWAAAQQHGSYYQAEGRMRRVDGVYRWYLHQAVPLKNERGQVIKWFGTATDIEDQKQLEQQRDRILQREQAAREEAERANRIKDEFLAVLSHELRSPLNPILGWAKLLQTRTFDEQKTKHALATIERNALLQTQLIEDLLDVSRILRGKLVLNAAPVNLTSTIEAALETVRLAVEAKDIQIQQLLDPNVGQVMGESARLQQVIWNLLSNAVKFTPSGGTIEIRLEQIHTNAQIQVKDTGKGINPQFLPHVFEYFRQEDGTTTRKFGGLGLGLAIVRHLVELHGGTVWAESPGEGLGATFTVRLPLMPVSTQTPQDNPPAIPVTHLTGLRILVVDDQPDIQDIVAFILEQAGAAVSVATSAPEALHLMEQFLPDVLICDIGMPNMDGYMLMRQIRKLPPPQGGKLPAIALTAYAGEVDQQQAIAAGFQMHIPKPVEPDRLVRTIARLVQHPRST